MHSVDPTTEQMIRSVLAYAENRLRLDPVPLDGTRRDPAEFDAVLRGLPDEEPHNADQVLGAYASVLAPAVISADSPRFLGFIPAAPTKAALLFDMLVSCASIQGISWLEASGAIYAENLVLRLIADRAGLPAAAGGCFVSGGSAANLSALVVAREVAKRNAGPRPGPPAPRRGRRRRPFLDQPHAAHPGDGRADRDHPGPPADRRRPARRDRGRRRPVLAGRGGRHRGHHERRASSTTWPARPRSPGEHGLWFHVDGAYGGAGLFAPSVRRCYDGIEHADSFVVDPHKWLFAPFDCAALLYRDPALARSVHKQDAVLPRRDPRRARRLEPDRLRLPPDPAGPRPAAVVLAVGTRGPGLQRGDRGGDPAGQGHRRGDRQAELPGTGPRARPRHRAVPPLRLGAGRSTPRWADRLLADQVAFIPPSAWEGETVARFAFLHPHTSMDLVRQILDRMQ